MFDQRDVLREADPRVRALYAWHAIEEVEHKGVGYDVMIEYAKVGYVQRVVAMLETSIMFPLVIRRFTQQLLAADGFSRWERFKLTAKGLWWTVKPGGFIAPMVAAYFTYYRVGFHPWQEADQRGYAEWLAAFNRSGDPVQASEQMRRDLGAAQA